MKESLSDRIYNYLLKWKEKNPSIWINGGEIERLALGAGYKSSHASRRARELAQDNLLDVRYNEKGHVEYQAKF